MSRVLSLFTPQSGLYRSRDLPKLTRDNDLDLVRLLLAACVVFFHTRSLANGWVFPLSSISAVPVFLFLSGLLITESFYGSSNLRIYIEKRIRRIYPGYAFAVILGGAIAYFGWTYLAGQSTGFLNLIKYYGINLAFANWLFPCVTADQATTLCEVNGSLWVMKWEVLFYALLPLFLILFSKLNKYLHIIIIAIFAYQVSVEQSPYIKILICFLMGVSAYYLKSLWMPLLQKLPKIHPLIRQIGIVGLFLIAWKIPYGVFLLSLMFIAFLPTFPGFKINTLKFGDISYGIFLIHFPLITGLWIHLASAPDGIAASLTIFSLSVIISILMYRFVEAPFLLPSSHYRKSDRLKSS